MADPARRHATYADLQAVPAHLVAEIVDGTLETHRALPTQSAMLIHLSSEVGLPFERARGGPGGWSFLPRPELHLGENVLVPELAGWRAGRFDVDPDETAVVTPPDWVCEILSPSTARLDRGPKRRIYAEAGVEYLWLLDPEIGQLEAFGLAGQQWLLLATIQKGEDVSVAPFDAISFPLDDLFPLDTPSSPEA